MAKESDKRDALYEEVVGSALEFLRSRVWTRVASDDPFRLRLPGEAHPLVCSVLGAEGEALGLILLRGEHAMEVFEEDLLGGSGWNADSRCEMLLISFETREEVDPRFLLPVDGSRRTFARAAAVPVFVQLAIGREGRPMPRPDLRVAQAALRAVVAADAMGLLRPRPWDWRRRVLELELDGQGTKTRLQDRVVTAPLPQPEAEREVSTPVLSARWFEVVGAAQRVKGSWGVVTMPSPGPSGDERAFELIAVVELETQRLLPPRFIPVGEAEPLAEALLDIFEHAAEPGPGGEAPARIPNELRFVQRRPLRQLQAALAEIGVTAVHDPDQDVVLDAVAAFVARPVDELDAASSPELVRLEECKAANQRLTARLLSGVAFDSPRLLRKYFGDAEIGLELLRRCEDLNAISAYCGWVLFDHRARKGVRTVAERALAGRDLHGLERDLLEARIGARLFLGRVVVLEPGASVGLENVLTGERVTVYDTGLSMSAVEGLGLLVRAYTVGDRTLADLAGPPVPDLWIGRTLDEIEALGVAVLDGAFVQDLHLLGRLFADGVPTPALENTDGEPLELLVGTFQIAGGADLDAELASLPGVRSDEADGWTWLVERPGDRGFVGAVVMGRFERIGDELLVQVNSRARLERAQAMLSGASGLSFVRAAAPAPPEVGALPAAPEFDPDLQAEVEELLRARALGWLDEKVPALDGLTPRAAASVPELRPKVERLIRTYPDSHGPFGVVPVPRQEMLVELGFAGR